MGYGFPGAVGAQIGNPGVPVIAISGDGGMQMNIQEFATAVLQELPLILCVFNNTYLGMVRQWQKLFYGKRYSMTCLRAGKACEGKCGMEGCECPPYTPDFVKLAESYGAKGLHNLFLRCIFLKDSLIDILRYCRRCNQEIRIRRTNGCSQDTCHNKSCQNRWQETGGKCNKNIFSRSSCQVCCWIQLSSNNTDKHCNCK